VVDPTVPVRGDEVTWRIRPSTLPVAGRSLAVVVAGEPGFVVVVELVDDEPHPLSAVTAAKVAARAEVRKKKVRMPRG
jgi:hypothetical protein